MEKREIRNEFLGLLCKNSHLKVGQNEIWKQNDDLDCDLNQMRLSNQRETEDEGNEMYGMLSFDAKSWSGQRFHIEKKGGDAQHLNREGCSGEDGKVIERSRKLKCQHRLTVNRA